MSQKSSSLLPLLLVALLAVACEKIDLPKETPHCVKAKIRDMSQGNDASGLTEVYSYLVDGTTYYLFVPGCCDQFIELYDDQCHYICAPSGGITGQGDGNCPQWSGTPETTLIWEQP
jgi:hypothetical protein